MRLLGVDLGDKRTGLALADTESGLVSPERVVETPLAREGGEALLRDLAKAVDDLAPGRLVVGLPLNMDGSEGARAKLVRAFAERLASRVGLPVDLHDERLSTEAARWDMSGSGLTRGKKKQMKDALAAAAILRDFLEVRPEP